MSKVLLKFLYICITYAVNTSLHFDDSIKFFIPGEEQNEMHSTKKEARIERKKKKMAALYELAKSNEIDRIAIKERKLENFENEPSPKRLCSDKNDVKIDIIQSAKEYIKAKKNLRREALEMRVTPKFRLREAGESAILTMEIENRIPIFLSDIQHLLMYSQIGHHSSYTPARWCQLDKYNRLISTNVLVIDNISLYHFVSYESFFPFLSSNFPYKLEVLSPISYNGDTVQDLATVPLTSTQMRKFVDKFGSLEAAVKGSDEVFDLIKNVFPVVEENHVWKGKNSGANGDKFPRTHLLLSGWQMVEENFPLPIKGLTERKYKGYILTKDSYKPVSPDSPMFGIDCEMCRTTAPELELTRVSIVDENMKPFYDELVKPDNKILDYLTKFSGITAGMMKNVKKTLKDVQDDIRRILPADAILVGQSLNNDMHALKMMHPYIIDTSIIFNITGDRNRKTKLQTLAREFLSERIQESKSGHCSFEDSAACLKLTKMKLSKNIYYGDAVMSNIQLQLKHHPELGNPNYATSMLKQTTKMEKNAFVTALPDITSKYNYFTFKQTELKKDAKITFEVKESNQAVIKNVAKNVQKHSLNIAHIRIPEEKYKDDSAKMCSKIDYWIKELNVHIPAPSLNIVLFGGHSLSGNGCCFIQLKT